MNQSVHLPLEQPFDFTFGRLTVLFEIAVDPSQTTAAELVFYFYFHQQFSYQYAVYQTKFVVRTIIYTLNQNQYIYVKTFIYGP